MDIVQLVILIVIGACIAASLRSGISRRKSGYNDTYYDDLKNLDDRH